MIVESEHPESFGREIRISPRVACAMLGLKVLSAIQLNDQLGRKTDEIDHVGTNWCLSAECRAEKSMCAQGIPDSAFGIGHIPTQRLGIAAKLSRNMPCRLIVVVNLHYRLAV
jgi:hypothetical protein